MSNNTLYYGDNLDVLRRHVRDESVDLVYLDPPFNSQIDYNILFAEQDGSRAAAQIKAFGDTWRWDLGTAAAFDDFLKTGPHKAVKSMEALQQVVGNNDMLAYLSMMAPRIVELRRVLKADGSLYLHCDSVASHYLKILLDAIFGPVNYRNEIIWKRTSAHSDSGKYGRMHDTILYYSKSKPCKWNKIYQKYDAEYVDQYYRYKDTDGRRFMSDNLSAAGLSGGGYEYEWKGIRRLWRCPPETMKALDERGEIFYTKNGIPRRKRYLDLAKGMPAQDVCTDVEALRSWHAERLGYPTQKPEALLHRIIRASSREEDTVLDPFCGCGTTVIAAQRLNRRWIGIDITHIAISLVKTRLLDSFGVPATNTYKVIGEPVSLPDAESLAVSDRYQFQWWALGLVGARPQASDEKKGADQGVDGRRIFHDDAPGKPSKHVIISVKSGKVGAGQVRDLRGTIEREKATIGAFITLEEPTKPMQDEALAAGFYGSPWGTRHPKVQILTIAELLSGKKLDLPPSRDDQTFKKAPKAKLGTREQGQQLPFDIDANLDDDDVVVDDERSEVDE